MKTILLYHAHIISPDFEAADGAVLISGNRIRKIFVEGDQYPEADESVDLENRMLMPGFIDVHTHGRSGYEITDADPDHLKTMSRDKLCEGVTSWLPTTLTLPEKDLASALRNLAETAADREWTKIPGVHLEGPFINPRNLGAQNPAYVRNPDINEMAVLSGIFPVLKASYAVEMEGGAEFAADLKSLGIVPSCVHSSATYNQFFEAYRRGLRDLSHFCNQMSPLHHRDIGLVGAGLMHDDINIEIICDRIHLSPPMIKLIFTLKDINRIQLITDGCEAAGMPDGEYEIGGLPLILKDGAARLAANGALAGSVLVMNQALKNVYEITGLPLNQLVKTVAYNQARSLGLPGLGKIEPGFTADITVLERDFSVHRVWVDGMLKYSAG